MHIEACTVVVIYCLVFFHVSLFITSLDPIVPQLSAIFLAFLQIMLAIGHVYLIYSYQ
jgi:hypothetical protein